MGMYSISAPAVVSIGLECVDRRDLRDPQTSHSQSLSKSFGEVLRDDGKGSAFLGEEKGYFVAPSGDGVVGDIDAKEIVKGGDDGRCG